jgi:hypothetical protein
MDPAKAGPGEAAKSSRSGQSRSQIMHLCLNELMPALAIFVLLLVNCNRSRAENWSMLGGAGNDAPPAAEKFDPSRFDQYGGDLSHPCQSNGYFRLYQDTQARHWYFCTPENHRFWMQAVQVFNGYSDEVDKKYKPFGAYGFYAGTAARLKRLGFNTIGELAAPMALPVGTQGRTDGGNPEKMPFIYNMNPTRYAFQGTAGWGRCADPAFDLMEGVSSNYKGWRSNFPDVFSNGWSCAIHESFANNQDVTGGMAALNKSRWVIGVQVDDADYMQGFKMGPESGTPSIHTGWLAGVSAPYRRYSKLHSRVFANDPWNHTKLEWKQFLQKKYGSIGALNAAWKSDYLTWDSTAGEVVREPIIKGDGKQWEYTVKLQHAPVDLNSLGLYVDKRPAGGDCPWVTINAECDRAASPGWGILAGNKYANLGTGKIRYATGELTIQFSAVPPPGVVISASYRYSGWPKQYSAGRGLMDEDGTSSWWPKDETLSTISGPVAQDLDEFLSRIAARYFEVLDRERNAYLGNHLLIGPDALSVFTRKRILVEAAKHVNLFLISSAEPVPVRAAAAKSVYDTTHIPIYPYMVGIANPDSPYSSEGMRGCDKAGWEMNCEKTQEGRGRWYNEQIVQWLNNYRGSDGYGFVVGISWWQLTDNPGEQTNFGIISLKDNLYDGVQSRAESSVDEFGIARGGERRSYGAFTPWVQHANQCWWRSDSTCTPAK